MSARPEDRTLTLLQVPFSWLNFLNTATPVIRSVNFTVVYTVQSANFFLSLYMLSIEPAAENKASLKGRGCAWLCALLCLVLGTTWSSAFFILVLGTRKLKPK